MMLLLVGVAGAGAGFAGGFFYFRRALRVAHIEIGFVRGIARDALGRSQDLAETYARGARR